MDALLQLCAYFNTAPIPRSLLETWVGKNYPSKLANTAGFTLTQAIELLARYSIIEATVETITLHTLVQAVIRDNLTEEEQKKVCRDGLHFFNKVFNYDLRDIAKIKTNQLLITHVERVVGQAWELGLEEEMGLDLLEKVAAHLIYRGAFIEAQNVLNRCLEKAVGWKNETLTARIRNSVGNVLEQLGRYSEAQELYMKTLQAYKKTYPADHLSLAGTYTNLGNVLQRIGQYAEAKEYYEKALWICGKFYPAAHPSLAGVHNNLGAVFGELGQHAEAKEHYEKALQIKKEAYPADHPSLADAHNNLGFIFRQLARYVEAKKHYKKALQILGKTYPADHPSLADIHNNLGTIFGQVEQYAEAKECYEKALWIYEKVYPADHPSLGTIYNNL